MMWMFDKRDTKGFDMTTVKTYTRNELQGMTLATLRPIAVSLNIKGMSKAKKADIIDAIAAEYERIEHETARQAELEAARAQIVSDDMRAAFDAIADRSSASAADILEQVRPYDIVPMSTAFEAVLEADAATDQTTPTALAIYMDDPIQVWANEHHAHALAYSLHALAFTCKTKTATQSLATLESLCNALQTSVWAHAHTLTGIVSDARIAVANANATVEAFKASTIAKGTPVAPTLTGTLVPDALLTTYDRNAMYPRPTYTDDRTPYEKALDDTHDHTSLEAAKRLEFVAANMDEFSAHDLKRARETARETAIDIVKRIFRECIHEYGFDVLTDADCMKARGGYHASMITLRVGGYTEHIHLGFHRATVLPLYVMARRHHVGGSMVVVEMVATDEDPDTRKRRYHVNREICDFLTREYAPYTTPATDTDIKRGSYYAVRMPDGTFYYAKAGRAGAPLSISINYRKYFAAFKSDCLARIHMALDRADWLTARNISTRVILEKDHDEA